MDSDSSWLAIGGVRFALLAYLVSIVGSIIPDYESHELGHNMVKNDLTKLHSILVQLISIFIKSHSPTLITWGTKDMKYLNSPIPFNSK